MDINERDGQFEQALAMVPACALDTAGRQAQKVRYRTIRQSLTAVRRKPDAVLVDFGGGVDPAAVQELIAVERGCCPFLHFEFDESARTLAVTGLDHSTQPALDAIETAFKEALD